MAAVFFDLSVAEPIASRLVLEHFLHKPVCDGIRRYTSDTGLVRLQTLALAASIRSKILFHADGVRPPVRSTLVRRAHNL